MKNANFSLSRFLLISLCSSLASGCSSSAPPDNTVITTTSSAATSIPPANKATTNSVAGKENLPADFPVSLDKGARKIELDEIEEHEQEFDVFSSLTTSEAESYYKSEFRRIGWQVGDGGPRAPSCERIFTATDQKRSVVVMLSKDGSDSKVHFNFIDSDDAADGAKPPAEAGASGD
ncbi:MAG: hypothetical protein K2W95_33360 [Candidatus Obscuribacterales bacterium]|nr:hypothetical protein [Candidatus Obscuribacterales bacterium]